MPAIDSCGPVAVSDRHGPLLTAGSPHVIARGSHAGITSLEGCDYASRDQRFLGVGQDTTETGNQ